MSSSQQGRLDKAENAVDEAQRKVDAAEGELKGWRKEHQGEDPSETFEYKEVLRLDANLHDARKLYNDLVNQSQQPQGKCLFVGETNDALFIV